MSLNNSKSFEDIISSDVAEDETTNTTDNNSSILTGPQPEVLPIAAGQTISDCRFRNQSLPWSDIKSWLTEGIPGDKDGQCFIPGILTDDRRPSVVEEIHSGQKSNRYAGNISAFSALVYDIDTGQHPDIGLKIIRKLGLSYIAYASYSWGQTQSELPLRPLQNQFSVENPTIGQAKGFAISTNKLDPQLAKTVRTGL